MIPEWTLGDRMRKALEVSNTPVGEIAEYLEVNRATVGRWLHDKSPVKKSTLVIWAATTGVDLGWLETGTAGLENQTGRDQYAIRDSNPEPADMESRHLRLVGGAVNDGLTLDRLPGGWWPTDPREERPGRESGKTGTSLRVVS